MTDYIDVAIILNKCNNFVTITICKEEGNKMKKYGKKLFYHISYLGMVKNIYRINKVYPVDESKCYGHLTLPVPIHTTQSYSWPFLFSQVPVTFTSDPFLFSSCANTSTFTRNNPESIFVEHDERAVKNAAMPMAATKQIDRKSVV